MPSLKPFINQSIAKLSCSYWVLKAFNIQWLNQDRLDISNSSGHTDLCVSDLFQSFICNTLFIKAESYLKERQAVWLEIVVFFEHWSSPSARQYCRLNHICANATVAVHLTDRFLYMLQVGFRQKAPASFSTPFCPKVDYFARAAMAASELKHTFSSEAANKSQERARFPSA